MSHESWKAEFYPVDARAVGDNVKLAIDHSILKWQGLLPENLAKHGLTVGGGALLDDGYTEGLCISAKTCALCLQNLDNCHKCAITLATGRACTAMPDMVGESPWRTWQYDSDAKPMLDLLLRTQASISLDDAKQVLVDGRVK